MLRGLLSARGANASLVTVYIDGFFQEPVDVAGLFNIRAIQVLPCRSWFLILISSPVCLLCISLNYIVLCISLSQLSCLGNSVGRAST